MRKIKLQMQVTINGYVAGTNGEMDWMTWNWDDELKSHVAWLTETIDTIIMGRKLAQGFIPHWEGALTNTESPDYAFAKKMVEIPKVVFSRSLNKLEGMFTHLEKTNAIEAVKKLKSQTGKDIIAYGGADFVGFLVANNLIDEYHLFINPAAIPQGLSIFDQLSKSKKLRLVSAKSFSCGVTAMLYVPEPE